VSGKPVVPVLLAGFLSGCVHEPGPALPTPTSADDSAAIARIEAVKPVFVLTEDGQTRKLDGVRFEFAAVRGRDERASTSYLIPLDSIVAFRISRRRFSLEEIDRYWNVGAFLALAGLAAIVLLCNEPPIC